MFKYNGKNNVKTEEKLWKNISIGDTFIDGSTVKSIHESYIDDCYDVKYGNINKSNHCILSSTHLLLCDIKKCKKETKNWINENFGNYMIPTLYDKHMYYDNLSEKLGNSIYGTSDLEEAESRNYTLLNKNNIEGDSFSIPTVNKDKIMKILSEENCKEEKYSVVESDPCKLDENTYWLPVDTIFMLLRNFNEKIYCNKNKIKNIDYFGRKEVFCVETDSHKFETCGLVHHNSVTLRNIILHCLTHGDQIAIGLIDLKWTEFSYYKGMKNVVAVANTVKEAYELMKLGKEVMYKRNEEMSKLRPPINDIKDFKPRQPTNEVMVAGRKLKDDDIVTIRTIDGEEKEVTVKELEQYL